MGGRHRNDPRSRNSLLRQAVQGHPIERCGEEFCVILHTRVGMSCAPRYRSPLTRWRSSRPRGGTRRVAEDLAAALDRPGGWGGSGRPRQKKADCGHSSSLDPRRTYPAPGRHELTVPHRERIAADLGPLLVRWEHSLTMVLSSFHLICSLIPLNRL